MASGVAHPGPALRHSLPKDKALFFAGDLRRPGSFFTGVIGGQRHPMRRSERVQKKQVPWSSGED